MEETKNMAKRYIAAGSLSVFFLVGLTATAPATTVLKMSIEKMSLEAVAVIVGEVTDTKSAWTPDQTTIYTTVTIKVTKCVAGECADTVRIKQRGGTVGETTLYIPGMPKFSQGQKVLLFLDHSYEGEPGHHSVIGMCQGMFVVEKKKGGEMMAVQQGGAALAGPDKGGVIRILGQEEQKTIVMPLGKLIKKIKSAIHAASKSKEKP
jgi:hypothetical protein